jgi:putative transposase
MWKIKANMYLTKKIKINPTEEQVDVLWQLSEQCRRLYNYALTERKDAWKTEQRSVKYVEQQNQLPVLKVKFPEYNIVYSKVLQSVLKKLDANYKSFFSLWKNGDKSARPPKFRSGKYFMTLVYNQSGFKINNGKLSFSHKVNEIPLSFEIGNAFDLLTIKQIEIYNDNPYKGRGNFYVSITYEENPIKEYVDNDLYQAIDLGITKIVTAVNTQGKFFEVKTPRVDQYWNTKIDSIKSRRDHCKKRSKRWNRLHKTYRKMEAKKSNQIKDFQHKLSKTMIENTRANTIIVGDLNVKSMAQSKRVTGKRKRSLNRSTQNQGYLSRFIEFLTYKAELAGKKVIRIDESYTSKECCICGTRHNMPLWERIMKCDCGNVIDRDRNSAINIMKRFLSQNALWTSYQKFSDNLRQTGLQMDTCITANIQMT